MKYISNKNNMEIFYEQK